MEAGLFFPSGTQSNLAALMAHCQRGEEVIVGQEAHTYRYEAGGGGGAGLDPAAAARRTGPTARSTSPRSRRRSSPTTRTSRITRLLALENTIGGKVLARAYMADAIALARRRKLSTHLDGARIFNAAVKLGIPVKELCAGFDTVSVCLSKGLGAPAGTVLVGSARRDRARAPHPQDAGRHDAPGRASSPRRGSTRSSTTSIASPRTTPTPSGSRRGSPPLGLKVDPVQTNMVFATIPAESVAPLGSTSSPTAS